MYRVVLSLLCLLAFCTEGVTDDHTDFFESRVRPTLVTFCYDCHGPDEQSGGLRLDSREGWRVGGQHGPAIVPGNPDASLVIKAIQYRDEELRMPPVDEGGKLADAQIADLVRWVTLGAPDPRESRPALAGKVESAKQHWAFQPIRRPSPAAGKHPIDALIERKLGEAGFVATPPTDRHTLVRRAVYGLHGLPPNPAQRSAGARNFGQLIDSLLASPRYGERWGRHWLDVARYADTKDGVLMYGEGRIRPFAYTYRDYVIRSFNEDKPFDRFVHEQLAADQLGLSANAPELAAMGFLTLGRMFDNNPHDVIDDQIDTVTRGLLGLTVSCARCHDHKFDPLPTADYYSLYGVFASSEQPFERPRIERTSEQGKAFEAELAEKIVALREMQSEQYELLTRTARERTADYLVHVVTTEPDVAETSVFFLSLLPDALRPQIVNRWRKLIQQRAVPDDVVFGPWHDLLADFQLRPEVWRARGVNEVVIAAMVEARPQTAEEVAKAYGDLLTSSVAGQSSEHDELRRLTVGRESPNWFPQGRVWHYMSRAEKDKYNGMVNELDTLATKSPGAAGRAMVMVDSETIVQPVVFRRGDPTMRGEPVPRRFLEVISPEERKAFGSGSGRLDLAHAITDPHNPLTARVFVNRVWMHHFGQPLVENPSDFGIRTEAPLHLDLLDYLASELIRNGWRLKPLHRLIMTSAAYQRSSRIPRDEGFAKQHTADPTNRFLWRFNRRRLDLEAMRDTLLFVSGQLDAKMYGRPVSIDDANNRRRTVYCLVERQSVPDVVRNFDFASPDASVGQRNVTTVPQQALFAMNSEFVAGVATEVAAIRPRLMNTPRNETFFSRSVKQSPNTPWSDRSTGHGVSGDCPTIFSQSRSEKRLCRIQRLYEIVLGRCATAEEVRLGHRVPGSRGLAAVRPSSTHVE